MKAAIQKIKGKSKGGKTISCRKLALEMDMSFSSAYRILSKDLKMKLYKITVELLLKDEHKTQRKKIRQLDEKKVPKRRYNENLFSDEKRFDLDSVYHSENDRIWSVNREEANWSGGKNSKESYSMVRGRCVPCSV